MNTTPLCQFVHKVTASNRIVFGDLRRLQRNVLPTGATSREEVETLLSLDGMGQLDEDWPEYLVRTVKDFVLSASDPPGTVDQDTAAWLVSALAAARPRSATAIVRAIVSEAPRIDEGLLRLCVRRGAKHQASAPAQMPPPDPAPATYDGVDTAAPA